MIITIISVAIALIFHFFPQLSSQIPENQYLSILYNFVRSNPKGISLALLFMLPLFFLLVTFSATLANYRYVKELKTKYRLIAEKGTAPKQTKHIARDIDTTNSTPTEQDNVDHSDETPKA